MQAVITHIKRKINTFFERKKLLRMLNMDINTQYGFKLLTMKHLPNGFAHLSYKCLTSQGHKVVLRICRNVTAAHVELEGKLLDQLSRDQVLGHHTTIMISDKNGKKTSQIDGMLYCLFGFVENDRIVGMSDSHINEVARIVRNIHESGESFYHNYEARSLMCANKVIEALVNLNASATISHAEYSNMLDIMTRYNEVIKKHQQKTILHGDVHHNNLLVNKKNNKLVLIDFDDFCVGPAIIDLAIMVQMLCLELNIFNIKMAKKIVYQYLAASKCKIYFNSEDLLICILYSLVRNCEYYLRAYVNNREEFTMAYKSIQSVQACSKQILKELSPFNSAIHPPSFV